MINKIDCNILIFHLSFFINVYINHVLKFYFEVESILSYYIYIYIYIYMKKKLFYHIK